ncbi:hypothetical protein P9112_004430 [Eukaryota sp. TZLM1-RC]
MSDILGKVFSDFTHSPNLQHQQDTQQQHTTNIQKVDEETVPDPTSPFKKEAVERQDEVNSSATVVTKGTGANQNSTSPFRVNKEVTRTDTALSPLTKEVKPSESEKATRTDPVRSPLPNVASCEEKDADPTVHNQPLKEST